MNETANNLLLEWAGFVQKRGLVLKFPDECAVVVPKVDAALCVKWNLFKGDKKHGQTKLLKAYGTAARLVLNMDDVALLSNKATPMDDKLQHAAFRATTGSTLGNR